MQWEEQSIKAKGDDSVRGGHQLETLHIGPHHHTQDKQSEKEGEDGADCWAQFLQYRFQLHYVCLPKKKEETHYMWVRAVINQYKKCMQTLVWQINDVLTGLSCFMWTAVRDVDKLFKLETSTAARHATSFKLQSLICKVLYQDFLCPGYSSGTQAIVSDFFQPLI